MKILNRQTTPGRGLGKTFVQILVICWVLAAWFWLDTSVALAETFTVDSTADSVDVNPGDGAAKDSSNRTTLRAAIMEANALGGEHTIILPTGTYTLTIPGRDENDCETGDLDITTGLTIIGGGGNPDADPALTIIQAGTDSTNGIDKVITVNPTWDKPFDTTIKAVTIRHGYNTSLATGDGWGGGLDWDGGGKTVDGPAGTLTLYNTVITDNYTQYGQGGGMDVSNMDGPAVVNITKTTITNNTTEGGLGGGLRIFGRLTVNITDSVIDNNTATEIPGEPSYGGGIYASANASVGPGFPLTIRNTTISNNKVKTVGGGIDTSVPTNIENSTISGNISDTDSGGIACTLDGNDGETLILTNVTISGNRAGQHGGGLLLGGNDPAVTLTNVTITDNRSDADNNGSGEGGGIHTFTGAGTVTLNNTIVAGNFKGMGAAANDIVGVVEMAPDSAYNLIGNGGSGGLAHGTNNNLVGISDPRLDSLADNGGVTLTHALLAGSPALDGGSNALVPGGVTTDQRGTGFIRVLDAADGDTLDTVEIGAFEAHPVVEDISGQTIDEDTAIPSLAFNVGDADQGFASITVASDNTTLVPNDNIGLSGTGSVRSLSITPTAEKFGSAAITVSVSSEVAGTSQTMTDTFLLTVNPIPDPPGATGTTTSEDTQSTTGLVINRNPVDGDEVSHFKVTGITGGTLYKNNGVTVIHDNDFITVAEGEAGLKFTPATDLNTPAGDTFQFTVQAALDDTDTSISTPITVPITVTEVNDPPVGMNDTLTDVLEDSGARTISFDTLLANDSEGAANESGQSLTIAAVESAVGGTVSISGSDVIFTPTANYNGAAGFTYTLQDNGTTNGATDAKTSTADVSFNITSMPDAPAATGTTTNEDTQSTTGLVISRNLEDGEDVTHFKVTGITGGTLYKNDGTNEIYNNDFITAVEGGEGLKFTPTADSNTPAGDTFGFAVQAALDDSGTGISTATPVIVTVAEVNDSPVGVDETLTDMQEDAAARTISFDTLLANDTKGAANESGQSLTITAVDSAVGGTVSISGTDVIFTPEVNFNGAAGFHYTLRDNGTTNGSDDFKTDTAVVSFNIVPMPDPPAATDTTTNEDTQSTTGLVISRNPEDGLEVTHFKITGITGGTLFKHDGVTVIYDNDFITVAEGEAGLKFTPMSDLNTPAGDTFQFTVQAALDGSGTGISTGTTVNVMVNAVNDPSSFAVGPDQIVPMNAGAQSVTNWAADIFEGASNESAQGLTFTVTENSNAALFSVQPAISPDGTLSYTPASGVTGTAAVSIVLKDNGGTENGGNDTSDSQSFTIKVLAANGSGTMTLLPTTVYSGQTGVSLTFTYTADLGGLENGEVTITVPEGWSVPGTNTTDLGYTTATVGTVSVSGRTVTVSGLTLAEGESFEITYGDQIGGGPGAAAPIELGSAVWQTKSRTTAGGNLEDLAASPETMVVPGAADPDTSSITVDPNTPLPADNTAAAAITVMIKDAQNNPLEGHTVILDQGDGSSTITPDSVMTDDGGEAVFTVKSHRAETVTYKATDTTDGVTVTQAVEITFEPGVIVEPASGSAAEGGTAEYTVALISQPTEDVTINVIPDDQMTVDKNSLIFTTANYNTPQTVTVTVKDNHLVDGARIGTVSHTAVSGDLQYNSITVSDVEINIADNDAAGITVTESGDTTHVAEGGAADTYTVVLNTQPVDTVTISLDSGNQIDISPINLTFTNLDWNQPQQVTITAVDDDIAEGSHTAAITYSVHSGDPDYNGLSMPERTVSITDNDASGVSVVESGGFTEVTEGGNEDIYTIVLSTQPTDTVTVSVYGGHQIDVSPITLTFTTGNWNQPQEVTIGAVDDDIAEGAHTTTVTHSVYSGDSDYNGLNISDILVSIIDNDSPDISIAQSGGSTEVSEGGNEDTYTIVLTTEPSADVEISISDGSQLGVNPTSLTFTPGNWDEVQTVWVWAMDDLDIEGEHTGTVMHSVYSSDSNYNNYNISDITVRIMDNDAPDNAYLSGLELSSGTLTPAFSFAVTNYTVSVPDNVSSVTVTPELMDEEAAVAINGKASVSGEASDPIALNIGNNTITIVVTAQDGRTTKTYTITITRADLPDDEDDGGEGDNDDGNEDGNDNDNDNDDGNDNSGGKVGAGVQPPASAPTVDSNGNIATIPKLDKNRGIAASDIDTAALAQAFEKTLQNNEGIKIVRIEMSKVENAKAYDITLPASFLSSKDVSRRIQVAANIAAVTLPENMLTQEDATNAKKVSLIISQADASTIGNEETRSRIGDRPMIQLSLKVDGKSIAWRNENAPVTVTIPYTPTAEELANPEHITVWYIDGTGNVVEVPSGRYDPVTGMVTFSTTHFSHYAVAYVTKTFNDLSEAAWAKKPIEVLASKGILKGITETAYAPQTNITRADFLYFLVRTLGVDAKIDSNFDDISSDAYYYKEIAIAKKLGITSGTGNNQFNPDASITRQDMMVLTENALRLLKKLEVQGNASDLDKFSDKSSIASYAVDSMASVVKEGLIVGSDGRINPLGNTTRAEAAAFLYKIYNK